ncbi:hypothetical protein PGH43_12090 [Legionella pneumophila 130b]|nr:hypothetical protein PGH43_12090 [Legionella pneumophila 130b]
MSPQSDIETLISTKSWLIEKYVAPLHHPLRESAEKLILVSDYASRQIKLLVSLLESDSCCFLWSRESYFYAIQQISLELSQAQYMQELRRFRHTHFLRLLLLEIAGLASTQEVMQSWSDLADSIILHTLKYIGFTLLSRYGFPETVRVKRFNYMLLPWGNLGKRT